MKVLTVVVHKLFLCLNQKDPPEIATMRSQTAFIQEVKEAQDLVVSMVTLDAVVSARSYPEPKFDQP